MTTQSTTGLLRETIADAVRLVRLWVTFLRALVEERGSRLRTIAALSVAGAVLVLFGLFGLLAAAAAALAIVWPVWLSILIVALVAVLTGSLLTWSAARRTKEAVSELRTSTGLTEGGPS